ncbi:hypothetical protein ACK3ZI_17205 [Aeromonas caviae]
MEGTWFGIQTFTTQLMAMFQSGDQADLLDVQLKAVMGVDCRWQRGEVS